MLREKVRQDGVDCPDVVAVNKIDLLKRDELLPQLEQLSTLFYGEQQPPLVPVSAKSGEGVQDLLSVLLSRLPEGPQFFPQSTVSDQQDLTVIAELIREKLFRQLNRELPYSLAVEVEDWQPKRGMIRANIIVERVSQRYIELYESLTGKKFAKRIEDPNEQIQQNVSSFLASVDIAGV